MANYARNYRKSSAYRASGSPRSGQVPKPANDNWAIPKPANDNVPGKPRPFPNMPSPGQLGKAAARVGIGNALRFGRIGMDFYDLVNYYGVVNPNQAPFSWSNGEYTNNTMCSGAYTGAQHPNSGMYPFIGALSCPIPLQAVTPPPLSTYFTNAATVSMCIFTNPGINRYTIVASWTRTVGQTSPFLIPHGTPVTAPMPNLNPNLNPLEIPIFQAMPLFKPVPFHRLKAAEEYKKDLYEWISPSRIAPRAVPFPRLMPLPNGKPYINLNPETLPEGGQSVQTFPTTRPATAGGFKFRPPGKGTKEKKLKLQLGGTAVGGIVNLVTESLDVLNAFWHALPHTSREGWRSPTPQKKVEILYRHINEVNYSKAFENLLVNEVGDRLIGGVARQTQKGYKRNWEQYGLRGGYHLGPAL